MSATDELRHLLDERGVFWIDIPLVNMKRTCWKSDDEQDGYCYFEESDFGLTDLTISDPTPEQAVEATLGRGTCHVITIGEFNGEGTEYYDYCSNCDYEFDDDPPNYCPSCGRKVMES